MPGMQIDQEVIRYGYDFIYLRIGQDSDPYIFLLDVGNEPLFIPLLMILHILK
jgi:hypothetical protein